MTLMRATLHLAASHGFSGLGLREVSREADIAPTSFYRHFADIEELGIAIIEQLVAGAFADIVTSAQAARAAGADPLQALVEGLLAATASDAELLRFVIGQRAGVHVTFRQKLREQLASLVGVIRQSLPPWGPASAPDAAMLMLLDGCGDLLDIANDERAAAVTALSESLLQTTRSLLGCEASSEEGP